MHWTIAAPFFHAADMAEARWLDDFVAGGAHTFTKVARNPQPSASSWHRRRSRVTPWREWLPFWQQAQSAWHLSQGGCITVFPQLAATVGLHKRLSSSNKPLVAWCFNVGALYPGLKQTLTQQALRDTDRIVVHSSGERESVAKWLRLPIERLEFVRLQRAPIPVVAREDTERPFVLALGSAQRDYRVLFAAVARLGYRTVVVAAPHAVSGLPVPANVELQSALSPAACNRLAQQARLIVVPLVDSPTAAGQVTVVEALRMARPLITTRCIGTVDYVSDGRNGLLVPPGDVEALTAAIEHTWSDEQARASIAREAQAYAETHLSDEAAAAQLLRILNGF
jgi:glycosyltransferase involved in cell wall biosynthesis